MLGLEHETVKMILLVLAAAVPTINMGFILKMMYNHLWHLDKKITDNTKMIGGHVQNPELHYTLKTKVDNLERLNRLKGVDDN